MDLDGMSNPRVSKELDEDAEFLEIAKNPGGEGGKLRFYLPTWFFL